MKLLDKLEALEKGATKEPWEISTRLIQLPEDVLLCRHLRNHAAALLRVARAAEAILIAEETGNDCFCEPDWSPCSKCEMRMENLKRSLKALEVES